MWTKTGRSPILAVIGVLAVACVSSDRTTAGAALVRDSAGVRVVENVAPAWGAGEGWRLSDEPVLEIGLLEGEPAYLFSQIIGPRRLSAGSLALIDVASRELRIFDADGRHVRSFGRGGEGPGEFQFPLGLLLAPGDSLLVWDAGLRRASIFSSAGELGRTFRLGDSPEAFRYPEAVGIFTGGDLLASGSVPIEAQQARTGPRWSHNVLVRYASDVGVARDDLGVQRVRMYTLVKPQESSSLTRRPVS